MEVLVFSQPQLPCFQIWKLIQLKHPLKMGCLGQISRLHANTRCATQRRGDVGAFLTWKKRGDIIFFKEGGSWEVGAIFPSHKKWWANMSPTRCFFLGFGGLTKHSFFFWKIWFFKPRKMEEIWSNFQEHIYFFQMGGEMMQLFVSYKYLEHLHLCVFFLSSLGFVRNWW